MAIPKTFVSLCFRHMEEKNQTRLRCHSLICEDDFLVGNYLFYFFSVFLVEVILVVFLSLPQSL